MAPSKEEVYQNVQQILVDALALDDDEVTPQATLVGDLGAESIDFLDIVHRLEKQFDIEIDNSELFPEDILRSADYVQDGKVTAAGVEELKKRLPFVDFAKFESNPTVQAFAQLLTVQDLCRFIEHKLGVTG